ncbi:acylneuraminate cytidylyltransferase family protein [Pollutimonas thiosulfatoxidans]|uniref:Acylneuraminate cytidylyltransferase n=1 Tax=Pollutimonas thiosulfatoxidans TaxID=2028345 RepID=A0A410GEL0_9BURK|nr:acylneuraminate cytidylyltransferase family protein [Pollutimonas thiosulfatoxidans]QAA94709.1 acylneuraminate cytidylyltransferase [Pollutimonas thiosulfatoxidans]
MKVFAFVFARGGSKGLPGKNIRPLGGVPLIAHSIRLAAELSTVLKTYVSTDSEEIAAVAKSYGAEVIMRPEHLATDFASEWHAWQHAIAFLHERGEQFDVFLSLPATSPLRAREDIENCLTALDDTSDVVITVTPASRSPYFNMVTRKANGDTHIAISGASITRRQDAPEVFDLTTVAYLARPKFILESAGIFDGRVKSVIVPKSRAVDIDDELDFAFAEALYKGKQ